MAVKRAEYQCAMGAVSVSPAHLNERASAGGDIDRARRNIHDPALSSGSRLDPRCETVPPTPRAVDKHVRRVAGVCPIIGLACMRLAMLLATRQFWSWTCGSMRLFWTTNRPSGQNTSKHSSPILIGVLSNNGRKDRQRRSPSALVQFDKKCCAPKKTFMRLFC